jgi:hypothetical protein
MMQGITLILLIESRDEILLKGVGCDAPGFEIASLTLMTESAESNCLTLVKPRSTWVTPKIKLTTPKDPLDQVKNPCGQTVVKNTVKPRLNPEVGECLPEPLPRSPNFT